jgi:ABC-2 type transport system permease protein
MATIFFHALSRSRGQILGWGISLALYGGFLASFYDTFVDQKEQMEALLKSYPPELFAMFGGQMEFFDPAGFLNLEYFSYMPLIIGIFAVLMGSGLLAADEESGTLDLVMAYPISRSKIFFGRLCAFIVSLAAILFFAWLGFVLMVPHTQLDVDWIELLLPQLSLFSILVLFGGLALLLSMLLPSRRMSAMLAGLILVGSYLITGLGSLDEGIKAVARYLPMEYYQGGRAINGMDWGWFFGALGVGLAFFLLAWLLFQRRDIRVAGEGGWGLPFLRRRRQALEEG